MSAPVLKRYFKGDCTRCGRPLDRTPRTAGRHYVVLVGSLPTEEVWCRRCCGAALHRGHQLQAAGGPGHWLTDAEFVAYLEAVA